MESGKYGLPRGTCFIAYRIEVFAVAGMLWISWCVLDAAGFRFGIFFERARRAASTRPPHLKYLSTLIVLRVSNLKHDETNKL